MSTPSLPSAATEPADPTHLQRRARALHLSGLLAHWEAVRANPEHLAWTQALLDWEEAERAQRSLQRRLGAARIGRFKPLADFDWGWPAQCDRAAVQELMTLAFMADATNVVLVGPNGVGKSMLACNLAHQAHAVCAGALGLGPESVCVSWLPMYHDFALISGLLLSFQLGLRNVFIAPQSFAARPALWMETCHRERATATAAPDFAYALIVRRTTPEERAGWDLSRLAVVMSAAEPVRPATVDAFLRVPAAIHLGPERVLETNVFHHRSRREADLASAQKQTTVFELLLETLKPRVVFVHGKSAVTHVERMTGAKTKHRDFVSASWRGATFELITGHHLAYQWSYQDVETLGRRIKERCPAAR